jgi:hypothetical protein
MMRGAFAPQLLRSLALVLLSACFAWFAEAAQPGRATALLVCQSFGDGPRLECTLQIAHAGLPLEGAQVKLGAHMPSMPMAHSVKPIAAQATGTPGEYRGVMTLEMEGVWAVTIDVAAAKWRDRIVKTVDVTDCEPNKRCPALPPAKR